MPDAAPTCVVVANPDGVACDDSGTCHAGACAPAALVNGDFSHGLVGWATTGDAAKFPIKSDANNSDRMTLSTSIDGTNAGGMALGTVSQAFMVPPDAIAIRFNVSGGHAHVRLKGANGAAIEDCTGVDDEGPRIPVSWDLVARRGERLTITVEDDVSSGDFAYVNTTGFDVVRDTPAPLRNAQFAADYTGWETTGDGLHFNIFDDWNYSSSETASIGGAPYGGRRSLTTYARDPAATGYGDASRGTVSQTFVVPNDAVALRFNVHGGRAAGVSLYHDAQQLATAAANDSDARKLPVSWNLQPYRGMMLRLAIEDASIVAPFGYIGTSGFDLITAYNGP
jgi:hypothetical protein